MSLTGRQHNDAFRNVEGRVRTVTNRSGGVQGGISNGETIYFRVAFKPVATVMHEQRTVTASYAGWISVFTGLRLARGRQPKAQHGRRRP